MRVAKLGANPQANPLSLKLRKLSDNLHLHLSSTRSPRSMQDASMDSTAATLEQALVETLAQSSSTSGSPGNEQPDDNTATVEPEEGYRDGDLPEFSDPEPEEDETTAGGGGTTTKGSINNKLIPGKGMKGPAGRKKMPLSALKQRLTGSSSSAKKSAEPSPPPLSSSTPSTSSKPTKGKGKALKMTDEQLDMVISRFTSEKPELEGKVSRENMLQMIELLQIDEDTLKGKKGLMGKGTKDTG